MSASGPATPAADAAAGGGSSAAEGTGGSGNSNADEVEKLKAEVEELRRQLKAASNASSPKASTGPEQNTAAEAAPDPFRVSLHTVILFGAEGNLALTKT